MLTQATACTDFANTAKQNKPSGSRTEAVWLQPHMVPGIVKSTETERRTVVARNREKKEQGIAGG